MRNAMVASQHLSAMQAQIDLLAKSDESFLKRNYGVDSEYFELKRLPNQAAKKEMKNETAKKAEIQAERKRKKIVY